MFHEFEVCNTTRNTLTEEHFLGTVRVQDVHVYKVFNVSPENTFLICIIFLLLLTNSSNSLFWSAKHES